MLEHKCKECGLVWHDKEYDAVCPQCWSGEYTTEIVEKEAKDDQAGRDKEGDRAKSH